MAWKKKLRKKIFFYFRKENSFGNKGLKTDPCGTTDICLNFFDTYDCKRFNKLDMNPSAENLFIRRLWLILSNALQKLVYLLISENIYFVLKG